jgi:hypothetical protein
MTNGAMGTEIFIQGDRGSDFSIQFIGNVRLTLDKAFVVEAQPGNANPFIQRRWQNPAVHGQTVCVGNDSNYSMHGMLFREGATTKLRLYWCDRDASHSFVAGVVNISGGP